MKSRPKSAAAALVVVALIATTGSGRAADYGARITDGNRVGLTVTNYGFFGNNFISRAPSFEFPLGTGYEHMSRAGLWVGAIAISDTGSFTGVSAGIVDNAQGTSALAETEFTPLTTIVERSRIANSPFYSPAAVSDEDFECSYTDRPGRGPSGYQSERHTPLQIVVRQHTLGFSLEVANSFVVVRYEITNDGPPLRDLYVGQYVQLVSGDRNAYVTWPPSGPPGSWYYSTYVEYDSLRRMYQEHYCRMPPYPDACNFGYAPPWAAVKLLKASPGDSSSLTIGLRWWSYAPGDASRDTDLERYALLAGGTLMDPRDCLPGGQCSPIALLSVGPFPEVNPGETVSVDVAFVGGEDLEALRQHADFAQYAADFGYRLPAPPPSPRLRVESGERRLDLLWDASPETVPDSTSSAPNYLDFEGYRVYLGLDRQHLTRVAQFDIVDTTGFNTGLEAARLDPPRVIDGVTYRYRYRVTGLRDGLSYYGAVTSYDTGDDKVGSLESGITQNKFQAVPMPAKGESTRGVTVFPNPYRVEAEWDRGAQVRDHYLWFANLPARAVLRIYTLAGDRVFETRFDGASYRGEGTRGLYDPRTDRDTAPPTLSGASFAWDLVTEKGQALASGLYMFSVEDLDSGAVSRGKFLVVKSDREGR